MTGTQIEFAKPDTSETFSNIPKGSYFKRGGELLLKWRDGEALSLTTGQLISVLPDAGVQLVKKIVAHV